MVGIAGIVLGDAKQVENTAGGRPAKGTQEADRTIIRHGHAHEWVCEYAFILERALLRIAFFNGENAGNSGAIVKKAALH
jgi:hypothetical protein